MIDASKFALDLMAAVGIISLRADAAKIIFARRFGFIGRTHEQLLLKLFGPTHQRELLTS